MAETRGIRNNNPFNIKRGSSRWLGKVPHHDNTDPVFERFDTIEHGLRAGIILFRNYILYHRCDTYRKIIYRFAPSSENNVEAYLKFVSLDNLLLLDLNVSFKSMSFYNLLRRVCLYESNYDLSFKQYFTILQKYDL